MLVPIRTFAAITARSGGWPAVGVTPVYSRREARKRSPSRGWPPRLTRRILPLFGTMS